MPALPDLIVDRPEGLYCPAGDFHIDPRRRVERAVITHAHSDHARSGHAHYLAHHDSAGLLRQRLGQGISLQTLSYGEALTLGDVTISLHPAGHVLGSSQVRVEHQGRVWVASGDYHVAGCGDHNPTCAPFEPVRCDCFITESTFGLPIYRWVPQAQTIADVHAWWQVNQAAGRPSLLAAYSLGKAQRVLASLDPGIGPLAVHASVAAMNQAYAAAGVALPAAASLTDISDAELRRALVIAPPAAALAPRMQGASTAFASGWMQVRSRRQAPGVGRGFVLSDHADWPGLLAAIAATRCERVIVTHGAEAVLVRYLREQGMQAGAFNAIDSRSPAAPPG